MKSFPTVRDPDQRELVLAILHQQLALARGELANAPSDDARKAAKHRIDALLSIYRPILGDTQPGT